MTMSGRFDDDFDDGDEGQDVARERKRKSKFDLLPTDAPAATQDALVASILQSAYMQQAMLNASLAPSFRSVNDPAFALKLERAMEKNFSYLERKDALQASEHLLARTAAPSSSAGPATAPSPSLFATSKLFHQFSDVASHSLSVPLPHPTKPEPQERPMESTSVYVSNLPKDIAEEEIDILFNPQGKIKKIKIYVDKDGNKKGDALVTFTKAEHATLACFKLNKLDIGDGYVINVSKAEFKSKPAPSSSSSSAAAAEGCTDADWMSEALLRGTLGEDLLQGAVVVARNVFAADRPGDALDVETDLLLECCGFGVVKTVTTRTISDGVHREGCALVAFECASSAHDCAVALHRTVFRGRGIATKLVLPPSEGGAPHTFPVPRPASTQAGVREAQDTQPTHSPQEYTGGCHLPSPPLPPTGGRDGPASHAALSPREAAGQEEMSAEMAAELENVDAFLNSFL